MTPDNTFAQSILPGKPVTAHLRQSQRITNRIAVIFSVLTILLLTITVSMFGVSVSTPATVLTAVVYLSVIGFNYFGYIHFSRLFLCVFSPVITFYITYILKSSEEHTDILYYDSRILLLIFSIVPCMVFHTSEKFKLYGSLVFCLLSLVLFDPIHEWFGQGYYQKGFTGTSYYYINYISVVAFIAIAAGGLTLRTITEKAEVELVKKNEELQQAISEIETQNEEMIAQAEELRANQEKIEASNIIIQSQASKLAEHNEKLGTLVKEKSQELINANEELIKHNNELRQFSYTVSHNLRAPVARLLGLTNLLNSAENRSLPVSDDFKKLVTLVQSSAQEFDGIIRDLNKIIDIRNELYKIKEKVILQEEFDQAMRLVENQLTSEMIFDTDFSQAPFIYTVRPTLNSIFYNLISNAIKYRSHQRPLHVTIQSTVQHEYTELQVVDNGVGINLEAFGNDIFGLYKRFHTHTEGKGLGLYLVKSQIESLGGKIVVTSSLNIGTSFRVYFKIPDEVEGQVCFNTDYGTIFYNAQTNTAGIIWKQQVTSEQYRLLFGKCLEMLQLYRTHYWITDLRKQGHVAAEDQEWMLENIFPDAVRNGLERVAGIYDPEQHNEKYRALIQEQCRKIGVDLEYFQSGKEAEDWINTGKL